MSCPEKCTHDLACAVLVSDLLGTAEGPYDPDPMRLWRSWTPRPEREIIPTRKERRWWRSS